MPSVLSAPKMFKKSYKCCKYKLGPFFFSYGMYLKVSKSNFSSSVAILDNIGCGRATQIRRNFRNALLKNYRNGSYAKCAHHC